MLYNVVVVSKDIDNLIVFSCIKKKLRNTATGLVIYVFLSLFTSFCLSLHPYVCPEDKTQLHGRIFMKFDCFSRNCRENSGLI